jgi:hypothetical protein
VVAEVAATGGEGDKARLAPSPLLPAETRDAVAWSCDNSIAKRFA